MADPKFPYVKWRDGRPRSSHGAYARALGFVDSDLRHPPHDEKGRPVGPWFNLQEASEFSDKRSSEIEAARRSGKLPKRVTIRKRTTIQDLLDDWSKSTEFKALSSASQSSYRKCISAILHRPQTREAAAKMRAEIRAARLLGVSEPARELEAIATATPSSFGKPELRAFYNYARSTRGHHMALAMIATLSAAFTWGQESILWRLGPNPRAGMEFDHPDGRIVLVAMGEFSAWVAAADAIERASIGDSFYLALFTGQRQTDRLIMRDESDTPGRHAFRQSKTGELVDIKEARQLSARLSASRTRIKTLKLRLQLEAVPRELVVNEDNGAPYDESTYRHWVSTARAVAVFGFLARDSVRQAIVRAERLITELNGTVEALFTRFPLDEENKALRARSVDQRARALSEWLDAQSARDSNGDDGAWRLRPCPSLMFVNSAGELDQKHDQDLRDTCVMLLDRAGCDLLTICDITGHSYRSAQTIVKHYRARNADRADAGIDQLELQVRKDGMKS
ncbi:hypothetical protein [Bradyrhizobium septentrionale]|uniref:Tyr recombinase domain-containing protein n=1 Tax=Bradyrhizobium septentrionale TaxID=1404411 RepID=A0ABZ2P622_9BRAD